jgi:hypothetical protein
MRRNLNSAKVAWQVKNDLNPPTPGLGRAYA